MDEDLRSLREQVLSDFRWTSLALGQVANDMARLGEQVAKDMGNMAERMRQVEGRMRLMEQRFSRFLEAVDMEKASREELRSLESRVARLEEAS